MKNDYFAWYALYTKSRHEKQVFEKLQEKGINAYLPLVPRISQWKDRKKKVKEPLIRGYVFVKIDNHLRVDVLQTPGVVYFVKIGSEIPEIPEWQIDAMRRFIGEYGSEVYLEDYNRFNIGEKVRVTIGPLKGVTGSIITKGKKIRFAVGIDSIRSSFSVEIEPEYLEKIKA